MEEALDLSFDRLLMMMRCIEGKCVSLNLGSEGGRQIPRTTVGNALKQIYCSLDKVMAGLFPPSRFK